MKAPDQIYVREYPDGSFNPAWETKRKDDPTTVLHEYIRKEALLEWAQEQMRLWEDRALDAIHSDTKYPIIVGTFGLKRDMFKMFIDKLNEM